MKQHRVISMLKTFSRGVRGMFVLAVAASALSILLNFLTPQIIRFTVDAVIGSSDDVPALVRRVIDALGGRAALRSHLLLCALGVALCAALSALMNYVSRMSIARGTEGLIQNLRRTLFRHIQYLPFRWHTENQTGDTIQRCTSDAEVLRNFISAQCIEVVRTMILLTVALALMFTMNTTLALAFLAFIPVIVGYSLFFHTRIHRQFRIADEAEGELTVKVQENLTGVRVVRAFGREAYELEEFDWKNDTYTDKWIDMGYTLGFFGCGRRGELSADAQRDLSGGLSGRARADDNWRAAGICQLYPDAHRAGAQPGPDVVGVLQIDGFGRATVRNPRRGTGAPVAGRSEARPVSGYCF